MLVVDALLWWVSLVLVLFGVEFSVCSCWFGGCGFVVVFAVWIRVGLCLVDLVVLCIVLSVGWV